MILLIDNYDSFVYNLARYVRELGGDAIVRRNDAVTLEDVEALAPSHIILSPGPCSPAEAMISTDLVRHFGPTIPVFGVCLGHQCIGRLYGAEVVRAPEVMHGKTSPIHHTGAGVFAGLPDPLEATRYHSLVVDAASVPDELEVTAVTDDGIVMGLRHRQLDVEGVQFHPESILTASGHDLLRNFVARAAA